MRKVAVIAAVVVLAAVLLIVLLPRVVSFEAFRPRMVAVMEERTGRKVAFAKVSLSLFPGVGLKISGLSVSGDPEHPDEYLLTVPEAEIRVAILPLLAGRVEFGRVILRRPEVAFRVYRDGTHSATGIADRMAEKKEPAPAAAREPVSVAIDTLSIENAKLLLFLEDEDGKETRWEMGPLTVRLDGIGGRRNDFSIETRIAGAVQGEIEIAGSITREAGKAAGPAPARLIAKGKTFGHSLSVEGTLSAPPEGPEADVTVTFAGIDMGKIAGMFAEPPGWLSKAAPEGVATLLVKASGNAQTMGFEAEANLTRAGWTVMPGLRKFIDAPCTVVAQGRRFTDLYVLSNAELHFPPLRVIANASLVPTTGAREWTASARIASLSELAKNRGGGLSKWAPAGRITASGKGKRPSSSAADAWNISLDLNNVAFRLPEEKVEMADLDGHTEITSKTVDFRPIAGLVNGQRFSLRGTVSMGTAPVGQVSLRMPFLDFDAMFPPGEDGGKAKEPKQASPAGKEPGRTEFSARGDLSIDAGRIRGLEFRNLAGSGRYVDRTLFLDSLRARMYGGEAAVAGRIGFKPPAPDFRVKVTVKNLPVEEILSRKTSLKDFLTGAASLTADMGGGARDFDDFSRTASGTGSFRVSGGKIKGVDLLGAASGLSGLAGLSPARQGPGGGGVMETQFSELAADFRVEAGRIRTDNLRIVSEKMGLDGKAALGFDRSLDFRGTLSLPKGLSDRARGMGGKFLTGSSGRVEIPLLMSGPVTSPAIALDGETLGRGMAGGALRNLLDRPKERAPSNGTEATKPPAAPAPEKPLKGLFDMFTPGKK